MKISLQSIFNKAWAAFIVGDEQPGFDVVKRACTYKSPKGYRCAVGLCIPDGHPAQTSTEVLSGLVKQYPDLFDDQIVDMANKSDICDQMSLIKFQANLHDNLVDYNTGEWKFTKETRRKLYIEVAQKFNLTIPE